MNNLIGKRIRMTETMSDDPNPIQKGQMGTIRHVGGGVINVSWDNGRSIGVIEGKDQYEVIDEYIDTHIPKNNFLVFSGNI
jgi:hypothetical protein